MTTYIRRTLHKLLDFVPVYHLILSDQRISLLFFSFFFLCPQKFSRLKSLQSATKRHISARIVKCARTFCNNHTFFHIGISIRPHICLSDCKTSFSIQFYSTPVTMAAIVALPRPQSLSLFCCCSYL